MAERAAEPGQRRAERRRDGGLPPHRVYAAALVAVSLREHALEQAAAQRAPGVLPVGDGGRRMAPASDARRVSRFHELATANRRIRAALAGAGVREPELRCRE